MDAPKGLTQDRRIQKSRQAMCTAIFQLLENSTFTRVTVNDICAAAGISRTTFYQHFQDKYELIRFALEQTTQELHRLSGGSTEKEIHDLLDFVYKNKQVFRNLNEQNEELFYLLNEVSISSLNEYMENLTVMHAGNQSMLHSVFLAGGRAWLLLWWLKTDCQVPMDQLEDYLISVMKR